jgi:hypothetical protein
MVDDGTFSQSPRENEVQWRQWSSPDLMQPTSRSAIFPLVSLFELARLLLLFGKPQGLFLLCWRCHDVTAYTMGT